MMEDEPWISGRDPGDETKPRLQRECPRCRAVNRIRTDREKRRELGMTPDYLEPLPGYIHVRNSDGAIYCRICDLALFPTAEAAA